MSRSVLCLLTSAFRVLRAAGFNVVRFGAVADGVTDSTLDMQRAIDAAVTAGGGTVLLPP